MRKNIFIFITAIVTMGVSSCKKENKVSQKANCFITSVTYDDHLKYELVYEGDLVASFKEIGGDEVEKLFYDSDNLLIRKETYNNGVQTDIDRFFYDPSKRLTAVIWYSIDEVGNEVFESKNSFEYNSLHQIVSSIDSTHYGYKREVIHDFIYTNNRISKETITELSDGKEFKQEIRYSYTTTKNSFYTVFNQSALIFNSHPQYIAEFNNTDLLVTKLLIKEYEDGILQKDYFTKYQYTFENENLKSVATDIVGEFLRFNYKCE